MKPVSLGGMVAVGARDCEMRGGKAHVDGDVGFIGVAEAGAVGGGEAELGEAALAPRVCRGVTGGLKDGDQLARAPGRRAELRRGAHACDELGTDAGDVGVRA